MMLAENSSASNMRTDAQLQYYKPTMCYEKFLAKTSPLSYPGDLYFDAEVINDLDFDFLNRTSIISRRSSSDYSELELNNRRSALKYSPDKKDSLDIHFDVLKDTGNDEFMRTILEQNEDANDDRYSELGFH